MNSGNDYRSLDYFGKLLIEKFKDGPLDWFKILCNGENRGRAKKGLQEAVKKLDIETKNIIATCMVDAITDGLHDFLFAINQENDFAKRVKILVDGKNIAEISDQLNMKLLGEDGWEARFSKYPTAYAMCKDYNDGKEPKIITE